LADILEYEGALSVFRSADGSLLRALTRYKVDHPEDWFPKITSAQTALKSLTPDMLRNMDDLTIDALRDLGSRITQALSDREKLLTAN
jgi:hypothetical protein